MTEPTTFKADPFLAPHWIEQPTYGVDLTIGWPLPVNSTVYDDFAAKVTGLDGALYVYPFTQTHITVLTAVDFKHEFNPTSERVDIIDEAMHRLAGWVRSYCTELAPFEVEVGPPVVTPRAGFFIIGNPSGEIERLRQHARDFCIKDGAPLDRVQVPSIIHSTFLRFRQTPRAPGLLDTFSELARKWTPQRGTVHSVIVALELRPYLSQGKVAATTHLKNR